MSDLKATLLIVDDDSVLRMSLSEILTGFGHKVRSAEDGFSALFEIRREIPDIILSDLNMPGMSGFEFLSVVHRRFPSIQAIAMSGAFAGRDVPPGIAADAFYEKGSNLGYLLKIVEAMTQPKRSQSSPDSHSLMPIWIPSNGYTPCGTQHVMIACPECLRTFPQVLDDPISLIHQTNCIHCHRFIHFAVVQPGHPAVSTGLSAKIGDGLTFA
jgi:CheY-like chemotaxis protein